MKWLRWSWSFARWCAACVGNFALWSVWLILAALLVLQLVIASSHELRVPNRVIQSFRDRLAVAGLRIRFDSASFDPSGHVLIENLQIFSDSFEEPLGTCRSLFLQIDPWALLEGKIEASQIEGHELSLFVPPMLSPSGRSEPFVSSLEFNLQPETNLLKIHQLVGQAGPLAVSVGGTIRLGRSRLAGKQPPGAVVDDILRQYLDFARRFSLWQAELQAFEDPSLQVALSSDDHGAVHARLLFLSPHCALEATRFKLPALPGKIELSGLRVETSVPLRPGPGTRIDAILSAESLDLSDGSQARRLNARASLFLTENAAMPAIAPIELSIGEATSRGFTVSDFSLNGSAARWPEITADISVRLLDQAWNLKGDADLKAGAATVSLAGKISPAWFKFASKVAQYNLEKFVALESPATLSARVQLTPGWKLGPVSGQLEVGKLEAYHVTFGQGTAEFHLDGQQVRVENIAVTESDNWARGSYTMNTRTLDYRFLLTGALRPKHIGGWFHEWWTDFWDYFDFSAATPIADIDVQGQWGEPDLTKIFVHVDCDSPAIRSVPFDHVSTTLFIRPEFYDAVQLDARRGQGRATGTFTRSVDLEQHGFRWMEFDIATDLDLQESARIFGPMGVETVAPFIFEKPAALKIKGRLEGEASTLGEHEAINVDIDSTGGFRFFDFPLSDLRCRVAINDDAIDLPEIHVGFAGGRANGHAHVAGRGNDRRVSFNARLQEASLGEAIHILETYGAEQSKTPVSTVSAFQQRVAKGKLDITASAEGLYRDLRSFVGDGTAELKGAELAQINLLGSLSEALRGNSMLGFTSWALENARTRFNMLKGRIDFPDLVIKGPTAKLDAHGSYFLDTKKINFHAKFYPFDQGKTLLANAADLVLTPLSAALELKLTGDLADPKWFFEYGPTNLLRKIAGPPKPEPFRDALVEAPDSDNGKDLPPPLLRR